MRKDDEATGILRPVLIGLGAMVGASLLVGGLIAVVALGAVNVSGLGGDASTGASAAPSLNMPPLVATEEATVAPSDSESPESDAPKPKKSEAPMTRISLSAFPTSVAASERINLTGVYRGGEGAALQVQRFDGGWQDFPTQATVRGGIFTTWVLTGRTGENRFRMYDAAADLGSNPVVVTVG